MENMGQASEPEGFLQPDISCCLCLYSVYICFYIYLYTYIYTHTHNTHNTQGVCYLKQSKPCPVHNFAKHFIFALCPYCSPHEAICGETGGWKAEMSKIQNTTSHSAFSHATTMSIFHYWLQNHTWIVKSPGFKIKLVFINTILVSDNTHLKWGWQYFYFHSNKKHPQTKTPYFRPVGFSHYTNYIFIYLLGLSIKHNSCLQ